MSKQVLKDVALWFGPYDIQSHVNAASIEYSADEVDMSTFGDDTRINHGGLKSAVMSISGLWDSGTAGTPDSAQFSNMGASVPITVAVANSAGSRAFFLNSLHSQYNPVGRIGDALGFQMRAGARDRLIRGTLMESRTVTATGTGTARQLGAVAAGKSVYGIIHVTAASGTTPSLTVAVQSDNSSGFSSAATQFSFTAATGITSEFKFAAGAITDDYWRLSWTVSGTNPSFTFMGAIGIL